jgi:hypothetical protein
VGFDTSVTANGEETFGTTSNEPPLQKKEYSVKSAILFKLGYEFNDLARIEFGYNKFKNEDHYDVIANSPAYVLTIKEISTKNLFKTRYNIFPSVEIGITDDVFNGSINLNYIFDSNIEFMISQRYIEKGLGLGGGNNIEGIYLGIRYIFN